MRKSTICQLDRKSQNLKFLDNTIHYSLTSSVLGRMDGMGCLIAQLCAVMECASQATPTYNMIRRPLTEITLKIEDLQAYEAFRREQAHTSVLATEMQEDTPKSLGVGTKTTEEIHNRIGYVPKKKPSGPSTV